MTTGAISVTAVALLVVAYSTYIAVRVMRPVASTPTQKFWQVAIVVGFPLFGAVFVHCFLRTDRGNRRRPMMSLFRRKSVMAKRAYLTCTTFPRIYTWGLSTRSTGPSRRPASFGTAGTAG